MLVSTLMHGSELWCIWLIEKPKMSVFEMKCLRSITSLNRHRKHEMNEVIRRTDVKLEIAYGKRRSKFSDEKSDECLRRQ